jgi:prevent-host-death family protein
MQVSMTEARRRWYELIRLSESGEDVVVTYRGKPRIAFVRANPPDSP